MLIKLMKHEFRATGRIMLPLYLVLLVTAVGANLTTRGLMDTEYFLLDMLSVLLVVAFFAAVMGVCIMSMVVMVQRFYKNLLQDEGYVMMTLPVSVHQQVWSKLIVSAVWFAATFLMVCAAFGVMAYEVGLVSDFFRALGQIFSRLTAYYALNGAAIVLEALAFAFFSSCAMCLMFYAALAIGHSFARHKMAWSVLLYFGLQFALQMLVGIFIVVLDETPFYDWLLAMSTSLDSAMAQTHFLMSGLILVAIVQGAIFYLLTVFFLKRRLNLE